jgi:nitrate/TMAO reductase-like tetraheme cytochrome c subunit
MTREQPSPRKTTRRWIPVLSTLVILGVVVTVGGFTFAASQESHDPFCASCHTEPESTFFQRSTAAQAVDLASYHTSQKTRCIDCHSGPGVTGRLRAELMGAHNALAWITHTAVQPAKLTVPIADANCLKCHQDVTQRGYIPKVPVAIPGASIRGGEEEGRTNHWHEFLARWQAATPSAGTCISCHPGHSTDGTAQTGFENLQTTETVCNACHQTLREGRGD